MKISNGRRCSCSRAFVQHDVVDGHVHRVIGHRRLDLVGGADQHLGTLELLVHPDDVGAIFASLATGARLASRPSAARRLVLGLLHAVLDDLLVDLDALHHRSLLPSAVRLELAVVAFFQGVEQVRGGVHLAVVFDLLVALDLDLACRPRA